MFSCMNRLYFGDNLKWLSDRKEFPDASVDLVYLDPPFNSNADYNVLFREPSGQVSQAQFHAFTDTWSWVDAADTYHAFIDNCPNVTVVELLQLRRQVNRRDHAAGASATKFNRREFKRQELRVTAQRFALFVGQCSSCAAGKHQQLLATLIL